MSNQISRKSYAGGRVVPCGQTDKTMLKESLYTSVCVSVCVWVSVQTTRIPYTPTIIKRLYNRDGVFTVRYEPSP